MSCFGRALLTGCFERGRYFRKPVVVAGVMAWEEFGESMKKV
jgi:hypothetical protein